MTKKQKPTLTRFKHPALNEPIIAPRASLVLQGEEAERQIAQLSAKIQSERLRRFHLLFDEFGIRTGEGAEYLAATMALAFALATKYVPGMQIVERRTGPGAPQKQTLWSNPTLLLAVVDLTKQSFGLQSDKKACEHIIQAENPSLKSRQQKTTLDKRVRSLANLISRARKDAATVRH